MGNLPGQCGCQVVCDAPEGVAAGPWLRTARRKATAMPLTLEQYATYLDSRRDLHWPAPPQIEPPSARPHLVLLPGIRAVLWNVYGTLLAVPGGELYFEHPNEFVMDTALDKTIQEFKMWGAMTRKPGQPADYLRRVYLDLLAEQRLVPGKTEKYPEVLAERLWEGFLKKLLQKDYKFDAGFYGSLNEFSKKIAYFFHASLQGTACFPKAATALNWVKRCGLKQGLLADGQVFSVLQLHRGLRQQVSGTRVDDLLDPGLQALSCDVRGRKPSERLFRHALQALSERGIAAEQVLHVGSRLAQDVAAAKRAGMRTALFAGDRAALQMSPEDLKRGLKDPAHRPDVLLTELDQITEVVRR
jgi:FMN phosphatase YigB (HAD superfamily)